MSGAGKEANAAAKIVNFASDALGKERTMVRSHMHMAVLLYTIVYISIGAVCAAMSGKILAGDALFKLDVYSGDTFVESYHQSPFKLLDTGLLGNANDNGLDVSNYRIWVPALIACLSLVFSFCASVVLLIQVVNVVSGSPWCHPSEAKRTSVLLFISVIMTLLMYRSLDGNHVFVDTNGALTTQTTHLFEFKEHQGSDYKYYIVYLVFGIIAIVASSGQQAIDDLLHIMHSLSTGTLDASMQKFFESMTDFNADSIKSTGSDKKKRRKRKADTQ